MKMHFWLKIKDPNKIKLFERGISYGDRTESNRQKVTDKSESFAYDK